MTIDDVNTLTKMTVGLSLKTNYDVTNYTTSVSTQDVSYNQVELTTLDVHILTNSQSYSMLESTSVIKIPDLTCTTGSTSITYSIEKYNTKPPTWVTIDKATGQLNINAPNVSADTNYSFYINSAVSGISDPVKKLVSVTVQN